MAIGDDQQGEKNLAAAVLRTLAYFDVFDFPLTALEAQRWLWRQRASVGDVASVLKELERAGRVQRAHGYFHLPGRPAVVAVRWRRYLDAELKFRRAQRAARWLRFLPAVRLLAVCNNAAYGNAKAPSDIDLFIVTAPGRLWSTRLAVTAIVQLLGLRRHGRHVANRCCLSFYVTANAGDLSRFSLAPNDPYLVYWLATLALVYARPDEAASFWRANVWMNEWLPNWQPRLLSVRRSVPVPKRWLLPEGSRGLEQMARRLQRAKMAARERQHPSRLGVAISDDVLKFHEEDRRSAYRQQWEERCQAQGV
ncbi:MAG: hypothetical protein Q7S23_00335 [bacterium]|nr:hypothetical protein [bacterium]